MKSLISIVVPVYKVPVDYLKRCIYSLINQTYKNLEILLVDDGSPDNCGSICDELSKIDDRIKVYHKNNGGLSSARNYGVKKANGYWLMFVDGDDFLEFECCEQIINRIDKNIDLFYFQAYRVSDGEKKKLVGKNCFFEERIYSTDEELNYFKNMTLNYNAHISTAWGKLFKRDFLIKNNIFHDEYLKQGAEGIEFCIRVLNSKPVIKYSNLFLYDYIYNSDSISSFSSDSNNYYVLNCFNKIKDEIDISSDDINFWFYNRLKYVIITSLINGYFSPKNNISYRKQKELTKNYLKSDLVIETLNNVSNKYLDKKRIMLLYLIKYRLFIFLKFIQIIRKIKEV